METLTFDVGETFLLRFMQPADDKPYDRYYHWPKGGYPHTCTLETPGFDGKCVFCHFDREMKDEAEARGQKANSSLYRRHQDVLEVIDFRYFHVVPDPNRDGKDTVERCSHNESALPSRVRCHNCNSDDPETSKRYFGGHKVFEMNRTQYNQVWAAHEKLSNTCIHVNGDGEVCGAKVYPVSYICEGCQEEVISEDEINRTPPAQLEKQVNFPHNCSCGHTDYLFEVSICENGGRTPVGENDTLEDADHGVVRAGIFDKVLEVTVAGEQQSSGDRTWTQKNLSFGTGAEFSSVLMDLEDSGFSPEEVENMVRPWSLDHRYRPERLKRDDYGSDEEFVEAVLDAQAESIGKKNPFQPSQGPRPGFGRGRTGHRSFR
jgi:hypothetical protein